GIYLKKPGPPPSRGRRGILERHHDRAGDERGVVDADFLAQPKSRVGPYQGIQIAPGAEHTRVLVGQGLEHHEVRPRGDASALLLPSDLRDAVAPGARRVDVELLRGVGAVPKHAEALTGHQAERQALVVVLLRDDAVEARLDEELRPALNRAAVNGLAVFGVEVLELLAEAHSPTYRNETRDRPRFSARA